MAANTSIVYLSNIDNFPTTKRESKNKLLTENSLTRLINRLLNVDGFIITDGIRKTSDSNVSGDRGELLEINNNLKLRDIDLEGDLLEFVIRGYYFSTNKSDLLTSVGWSSYVDAHQSETTPFGLFARIFIDTTSPDYPELLGQEAYDEETETYKGVQFYISPINDLPSPSHPYIPTDASTTLPIGLGTNYFFYDLMLLEYINNDTSIQKDTYIPFASMNKFGTHSERKIDGGEIKIYS